MEAAPLEHYQHADAVVSDLGRYLNKKPVKNAAALRLRDRAGKFMAPNGTGFVTPMQGVCASQWCTTSPLLARPSHTPRESAKRKYHENPKALHAELHQLIADHPA